MAFRHYLRRLSNSYRHARSSKRSLPRLHVEGLEDRSLLSISAVAGPDGLLDITANGGAGNDSYHVRLNAGGSLLEIFENTPTSGSPTFSISRSSVDQLTINGNLGNDTLTVDFANGNPMPAGGLFYNGGGGTDRLRLQGGSFFSETHTVTGATSGTIRLSPLFVILGQPVPTLTYSLVQDIDDVVPLSSPLPALSPRMTYNTMDAAETINLVNGPVVNLVQTTRIDGPGATLNFGNKPHVTVNTLGGVDVITLNHSLPGSLDSLTIDAGAAGDTINVERTLAGLPVTVNAGAGADVINVSPVARNLDNIDGNLTVNGGADADWLNIQDQNNIFGDTFTLTGTTVDRGFMAPITHDTVETVNLNAGGGSNTFNVVSIDPAVFLRINAAGGTDTLAGPNTPNTWNLTGPGSGTLNGTVSYSNMANLRGGAAQDRFRFLPGFFPGSVPGSIQGNGGSDWLDYSALATGVTVNLALGTATGAGGGVSGIENVSGGGGNDSITGNALNNILLGRGGNDVMNGGSGRDIMIGGFGADVMDGDGGEDILVGTNTPHDNNPAALAALMAEWSRLDLAFNGRVAHLIAGGGLNGAVTLNPAALANDGLADTLTGGAVDRDWFLIQPPDILADFAFGTDRIN
jgi:hypothetical protein